MSYYGFRPYVPVAQRRAQAAREVEKLKKKGQTISPVAINGRKIAESFWGKAWCDNLERYSDFANRLPRGRTYVRNGSVVDLQIERGMVRAMVSGSSIYKVKIDGGAISQQRWRAIVKDCAGSIGSLVELLSGKLSKNVMERVCREGDGLFPAPTEIKMSCSCPDWAGMCKHVAATLYGAGARLDAAPDLLFTLRGVDRTELIAAAGAELPMTRTGGSRDRILADDAVAAHEVQKQILVRFDMAIEVHGDKALDLQEARVDVTHEAGIGKRHLGDDVVAEPIDAAPFGKLVHARRIDPGVDRPSHQDHRVRHIRIVVRLHDRDRGHHRHRRLAHSQNVGIATQHMQHRDQVIDVIVEIEAAF